MYARCKRRVRKQSPPSRLLGQVPRRARERIEAMVRCLVPPVDDLVVVIADFHVQTVVQQPWVFCAAAIQLPSSWRIRRIGLVQTSRCPSQWEHHE